MDVADPAAVRFAAIGDVGTGSAGQRAVAAALGKVCEARGCDFALLLGDNRYPRGFVEPDDPRMTELFTNVYGHLDLRFYAALGNHDYGHGRDLQAAQWQIEWASRHDQFVLPAQYYVFSAGPADLFAMDTTRIFWDGTAPQAQWLDDAIEASAAPWKVAFGHHTFRSNGKHGNAGQYEGWRGIPWASGRSLKHIFDEQLCGRVDLVLSGHDHNRQWISHCDTELVVSGAGAKSTPLHDRGNRSHFEKATIGLAWVELSDQLTVAFYDAEGRLEYQGTRQRADP